MTVDVTDEARAEPLQIIIVDVGHGNSAIVRDGAQFAVIDTGNKTQTATVDELDRLECRRIDHLVISHSDVDHVGGAARLILDPDREIGKIWYNSDGAKQTAVWARFVRAAHMRELQDESATEVSVSITTGTKSGLKFGRVTLEVVHPSSLFAGHGPTPRRQRTGDSELPRLETNSLSVVIRVLFGQKPVALLAADMDGLALQHIVQYNRDLAASILIFPHHGGLPGGPDAATFTNQLTSLVAPEVVVFSMEGGGAFSNPRPEVVAAVRQAAPEAHVACTQVSIHCYQAKAEVPGWHLSLSHAAGRAIGRCCIGTLTAELAPDNTLVFDPALKLHRQFIGEVLVNPLCGRDAPVPPQRSGESVSTQVL